MNAALNNCSIIDPEQLQYIGQIVNQILDKEHELGSLQNFQSTLKELSLSQGREIQLNLVNHDNQLVGFNFSFADEPQKTTSTIPFQQQLVLSPPGGSIIPQTTPYSTIDVATTKLKGQLSTPVPPGQLVATSPLSPEQKPEITAADETAIKSAAPHAKLNPSLARIAALLASRQEIDGLWLTGMTLKTETSIAKALETSSHLDSQLAGQAIIKRFEQILPQQFAQLNNGSSPQPFNWKDPHSGTKYRFELAAATFSPEGQLVTPTSLKGFAPTHPQPVFSALLTDAKRHHWLVEQCDFNEQQLNSLTACIPTHPAQKSTDSLDNSL